MPRSPSPDIGRLKPSLAILVAISMVSPAGINIIAPSLPAFVDVFGTDYATVQLTLSLFLAAVAVVQLIIGPLSDYFGRRPVILWGMALSALGSLLCVLAPNIETFIIGRILQGAGACTGIALARAIIRDLYQRDRAASMIGYVTMAMTVAPMIVPYLGGFLQEQVAWWGSSLFMLLFAVAVFIGSYFDLHETNPYLGVRTSLKELATNYFQLAGDPQFLRFAGVGAFASCIFFAFMGGAPLISTVLLNQSPTEYGLYFILVALGYGIGNFLSGRFVIKLGVSRMIFCGCSLGVLAIATMAILFTNDLIHPISLFGPMLFASVSNGLTLPSAIAGAVSAKPEIAGSASGLIGFMQIGSGAIAATLTAAWLDANLTIWPLIIIMAVASVLAIATALLIVTREKKGLQIV